jgi:6,7-dimethyl-8-ribityllumazine synthase
MITSTIRIAIVISEFNKEIMDSYLQRTEEELIHLGLHKKNITVTWVPGAFELPWMAKQIALSKKSDAIICLGCVIKGETSHDVVVSSWAAQGIGLVGLETGMPVLFGVLTPHNEEQAWERVRKGSLDRGKELAIAAVQMINLKKKKGK